MGGLGLIIHGYTPPRIGMQERVNCAAMATWDHCSITRRNQGCCADPSPLPHERTQPVTHTHTHTYVPPWLLWPVSWLLDLQTKWVVSAIAFAVLLTRRDTAVAWAVLGSIVSTAICKVCAVVVPFVYIGISLLWCCYSEWMVQVRLRRLRQGWAQRPRA